MGSICNTALPDSPPPKKNKPKGKQKKIVKESEDSGYDSLPAGGKGDEELGNEEEEKRAVESPEEGDLF